MIFEPVIGTADLCYGGTPVLSTKAFSDASRSSSSSTSSSSSSSRVSSSSSSFHPLHRTVPLAAASLAILLWSDPAKAGFLSGLPGIESVPGPQLPQVEFLERFNEDNQKKYAEFDERFKQSPLLKKLLEQSKLNKEKNKQEIQDKYCLRGAEWGVGDCSAEERSIPSLPPPAPPSLISPIISAFYPSGSPISPSFLASSPALRSSACAIAVALPFELRIVRVTISRSCERRKFC
ncbi:hypothetical protein BT93_G1757 [Corymbia citriodora subsp. variegata]|nr:hypothetical protein BT93_G1757 [Corymbia citriodora subsp. variegata]